MLKPEFFRDEDLCELPFECRLLFAGLWGVADREGRLKYRPKVIKADVFPYDEVDIVAALQKLIDAKFLLLYDAEGGRYLQIRSFAKHQHPHVKEPKSAIPAPPEGETPHAPDESSASTVQDMEETVSSRAESESESESESVTESESGGESERESANPRGTPASPPPQPPAVPQPPLSRGDVDRVLAEFPLKLSMNAARFHVEKSLANLRTKGLPRQIDGITNPVDWLVAVVRAYAESHEGQSSPREARYWFQDERYTDDPAAWDRKKPKATGAEPVGKLGNNFNGAPPSREEIEEAKRIEKQREISRQRRQAELQKGEVE